MIAKYLKVKPKVSTKAYIAASVQLIGAVEVGDSSSIWFNTVLRADINTIKIGIGTNIQDGVVGHVAGDFGLIVGDYVTVGHGVQIHACTIASKVLIGIGAVILNGAKIGCGAQVAAGALVPPNTEVPPEALVMGVPAKVVRFLTAAEIKTNSLWAHKYVKLIPEYRKIFAKKS